MQPLASCVSRFSRAEDVSYVFAFPWVRDVWQIFIRAVEVNVVVVVTIEKRADVERATQADEVADQIGMTERDVPGVISAEAGPANSDAMAIAFAPCQIEHVVDDHVFVGVMGAHPVGGMD